MSEVNFYLKTPKNKKEKSLIYLYFSFNGKRLKYSTQEHVSPNGWNSTSQRARSNNDLNDFLKKLEGDVITIERKLRTEGKVTPQMIRDKLDETLQRKQIVKHTLFSFIENYIKQVAETKKESTLKGYRNTYRHLKEYKSHKGRVIDFEDINQEFYNDFMSYLTNKKQFAKNTIGKQIKNLKVFLTEASEAGINKNQEFRSRKFKVVSEEVETIYLNESELAEIYKLNLTDNSRLERVRDLFIVGCYTGLRFSDFSSLQQENIDLKKGMITVKTIKMNQSTVVPIHPFVLEILKKYKKEYHNSLPPALSNQKMNDYLKEIGELAQLNGNVQISHIIGNKRKTEVFPKYSLITTHTARRSFATNLYLADFPTLSIMNITGHKTERAFMKYIKVTAEQHAQKLQKFWNFNNSK